MYIKTTVIGRLTRDIEMKMLNSGTALGSSAIAYETGYGQNKKSSFLDFTAFGKTAEIMNQYLKKGSLVLLEGELQQETWTDQQGQKRSKHALIVNQMKMLDSKNDNPAQQNQGGYQNNNNRQYPQHNAPQQGQFNQGGFA